MLVSAFVNSPVSLGSQVLQRLESCCEPAWNCIIYIVYISTWTLWILPLLSLGPCTSDVLALWTIRHCLTVTMVIGHASHHLILLLRTPLSVPPRWVNLVFVKVKYKKVKKYIYGEKVTNMVINTLVGRWHGWYRQASSSHNQISLVLVSDCQIRS